jgi:hypothetical protein
MHLFRIIIAGVAFAALTLTAAGAYPTTLTVNLDAQSGSGETGTATLTQRTDGVVVVIALENGATAQPAHIHEGTCDKLNPAPKYSLGDLIDGGGTWTLITGITIDDLLKSPLAISVDKRTDDKTYVACGNIEMSKPPT